MMYKRMTNNKNAIQQTRNNLANCRPSAGSTSHETKQPLTKTY
jgi:hypothetical protein